MEDDFVEKNKEALVEEMQVSIHQFNSLVQAIVSTGGAERLSISSLIPGITHQIGFLSAVFNQYVILLRGNIGKITKKSIGFNNMLDEMEEKEEKKGKG